MTRFDHHLGKPAKNVKAKIFSGLQLVFS